MAHVGVDSACDHAFLSKILLALNLGLSLGPDLGLGRGLELGLRLGLGSRSHALRGPVRTVDCKHRRGGRYDY